MNISISSIYKKLLPYEIRYWLYKQRNREQFRYLRTRANPSAKGTFSIRQYDKYRCIFIHISKSAGTSIAMALFNELPYHYTSVQYRVIFGRRDFGDYYKFAFVRNPWDRLYSAWNFLKQGGWDENDAAWSEKNLGHIDSFNDFVCGWLDKKRLYSYIHFWPQTCFISDRSGKCLVDFIGYFETLQDDFEHVASKLGIRTELPHKNPSRRSDYRNIYTLESIDRVADLYKNDIDRLGYSFDGYSKRTPWKI